MNSPRFVLDTNLIVSALLFERSLPRRSFEAAVSHGKVLISDETQAELTEVLMRKEFDRYISEQMRMQFLARFLSLATPIKVNESIEACRDPKDDKFLELAVGGGASHIVSGDADLLDLHPFCSIAILSPADFLQELNEP